MAAPGMALDRGGGAGLSGVGGGRWHVDSIQSGPAHVWTASMPRTRHSDNPFEQSVRTTSPTTGNGPH